MEDGVNEDIAVQQTFLLARSDDSDVGYDWALIKYQTFILYRNFNPGRRRRFSKKNGYKNVELKI